MSHRPRLLVSAFLFAVTSACASGGATSSNTARRASDTISASELEGMRSQTLFEAIRTLHPSWVRPVNSALASQGAPTPKISVFYAGERADQGIDHLSTLAPSTIALVKYLGPAQGMMAYGGQYQFGVLVLTRK